jgi:hypothetical protein
MGEGFLRHKIATPTTIRIIHTSLFVFFYYLMIGLLLAVSPRFCSFLDLAMGVTGPIAGFIIGKSGYWAIFLCGSRAASCACVLSLLLYHLVREPHPRLSPKTLEPLETEIS